TNAISQHPIWIMELQTEYTILTDPMTGYMISALTHHKSLRNKFFRGTFFKRFSYYDYSDNPLDKYSGDLLVVNLRTDVSSNVGRLTGHWRENEWTETQGYYPDVLLEHLEERPEKFELLWSHNKIWLYRINSCQAKCLLTSVVIKIPIGKKSNTLFN
ncbi:MAG: hypothetical protein AAF197_12880, partial [Pseudomonadota bacterium]